METKEYEILNTRYDLALQKLIDTRIEIFEKLKHLYAFLPDRIVERYFDQICTPLQDGEELYCQAIYEIALEKESEFRKALPDDMTSEDKMNQLRTLYIVWCSQITGYQKKDETFASVKLFEYITEGYR